MTDHVRAGSAPAPAERWLPGAAAIAVAALACGRPGAADAATATSAADFGGMDKLVAAAKEEGKLNVIALPPDWANYGEMIETFAEKYGIKVNSAQPDASSQDEINAANQLRGQDRAPDVFDLGANVALRNTDLFAPYKVATWGDIPDALKDPDGLWVSDYGGYMSIGYDAGSVPAADDRRRPAQAGVSGKVALNGNPTQAVGRLPRRDDGRARQRRLGRRHRARRRVLQEAQGGRQPPAGRPDAGHDRVRPDPGRDRLGLPERRPERRAGRASSTGRWSCPRAPRSAPTTSRRSTRTPRTRRPPGSGRSSCTPTRARTSG